MKKAIHKLIVFKLMYRYAGTEFFFARKGRDIRPVCIDCGSRISWRRLLRREFRYSSCRSCDGFIAHMSRDFTYEKEVMK